VRELSCGYDYELDESEDGTLVMSGLRMNHCAVVEQGRAGNARILDAAPRESFETMCGRYLGRDPMQVTKERATRHVANDEDLDPMLEDEDTMAKRNAKDEDPQLTRLLEMLAKLIAKLESGQTEDKAYDPDLILPDGHTNAPKDRPRNPIPAADSAEENTARRFEANAKQYLGKPVVVGQPRKLTRDEDASKRRSIDRRASASNIGDDFERNSRAARDWMTSDKKTETFEEALSRCRRELLGR
jgi:hypothetical protein